MRQIQFLIAKLTDARQPRLKEVAFAIGFALVITLTLQAYLLMQIILGLLALFGLFQIVTKKVIPHLEFRKWTRAQKPKSVKTKVTAPNRYRD